MKQISLIAAVDENLGIGKNNELLCYLPADLQHFKRLTLNKPIIMGRKTFLSIGKPLPDRKNIILTRTNEQIQGVEIAHSLEDALNLERNAQEIMIIGGGMVFQKALPLATDLYLTVIHHQFAADVHFPAFNKNEWFCIDEQTKSSDEKNSFDMTFTHYRRK